MAKKSQTNYPSRWAIVKRVILTTAAAGGAVATAATLPLMAGVAAGCTALGFVGNLAFNADMRSAGKRADPSKAEAFRKLVLARCEKDGIKPPRHIYLLNPAPGKTLFRKPNAGAFRIGRMGRGMVLGTESLMDTLTSEEINVILGHELAHYKKAHARSAVAVNGSILGATGAAIGAVISGGWTSLPALAWNGVATALQLISPFLSRKHERRADRKAIKTPEDAALFRSALIKVGIASKRHEENERERKTNKRFSIRNLFGRKREKTDAFGAPLKPRKTDEQLLAELQQPPTFWEQVRHAFVGTHPPIGERLRMLEELAAEPSTNSNARSMLRQGTTRDSDEADLGRNSEANDQSPQRTPIPREPALAGASSGRSGSAPPPLSR